MKYLIAIVLVGALSGCSLLDPHERKKDALQREIEVLELKKRKALLTVQIEKIENIEMDYIKDLEK